MYALETQTIETTFSDQMEQFFFDKVLNTPLSYRFMLLSRLKTECVAYLATKDLNLLSAKNVRLQIGYMKCLWHFFPKDRKPAWLTIQDIVNYEEKMEEK